MYSQSNKYIQDIERLNNDLLAHFEPTELILTPILQVTSPNEIR